jgi:aspartyl/asparaginyl-tRNA synthetase
MDSTMLQEPDFSLEQTSIDNLRDRVGAEVTLRGWLYNKRSSKGIHFIILRDGTGLAQCVVNENDVDADSWRAAEDGPRSTPSPRRATASSS